LHVFSCMWELDLKDTHILKRIHDHIDDDKCIQIHVNTYMIIYITCLK
jgi:hypothetical protein